MKPSYTYRAICTRVIDGDTVQLTIDLGFRMTTEQRIRLLAVDTPELNDRDVSKRDQAKIAHARVEELLLGETVTIATQKADSFGRWLARIELPDGSDLGETLVSEGLASRYGDD